jgi:hypothetical protein
MTGDPDPGHMQRYCQEIVPGILTQACGMTADEACRVAEDIERRAEGAARLDTESREILASPYFEEAFYHEPVDAPAWMKAVTTLVVRNSWLEEAHARGPVNSGGIQAITTHGSGALSHLIAARRRQPIPPTAEDPFAGLADRYPRAWRCLAALRDALIDGGGRVGYRPPDAPIPDLPGPDEIIQAPVTDQVQRPSEAFDIVVLSGIDTRFDHTMVASMHEAAQTHGLVLGISALSRLSRNSTQLLRVLEYFLAHQAKILTTNYLLTDRDAWVRRHTLIKPNSRDLIAGLSDSTGLSGAHRKTVETYLRLVASTRA